MIRTHNNLFCFHDVLKDGLVRTRYGVETAVPPPRCTGTIASFQSNGRTTAVCPSTENMGLVVCQKKKKNDPRVYPVQTTGILQYRVLCTLCTLYLEKGWFQDGNSTIFIYAVDRQHPKSQRTVSQPVTRSAG